MKCLGKIAVTHFLPLCILKRDVLPAVLPYHIPSPLCHLPDKFLSAAAYLQRIQTGKPAVCHKTVLRFILHQMIFVLAPCTDRPLLQFISMKIPALLCHAKSTLHAHPVGKILHTLQVFLGIVQLMTVHKADGIGYNVAMHMAPVNMHTHQTLESVKPLFRKFFSKLQCLLRRNWLVLVPRNNVVCIHSAGIFTPNPLFFQKGLVYPIISDNIRLVRTDDCNQFPSGLIYPRHIFDAVPHGSMTFCRLIDCLIDRHVASHSFRNVCNSLFNCSNCDCCGICP